ncbi:MAG: cell division protein CrgA [Candidatus Actinomarinales bacterium]|nr:MAG: cell division protein CrgA [Candidatus Actinomarinales bacterium]|tara:strand:+ start:6619 stop:6873 length:255 start_codon:yes stop_codon:yes gene_type:complete
MPVSKKRVKNLQATKSKKLSSQTVGDKGPSSKGYVIIMTSLMVLGVLIIVFNYLTLLPGSVSKWYLWSGLGLIGVGFIMTTEYR